MNVCSLLCLSCSPEKKRLQREDAEKAAKFEADFRAAKAARDANLQRMNESRPMTAAELEEIHDDPEAGDEDGDGDGGEGEKDDTDEEDDSSEDEEEEEESLRSRSKKRKGQLFDHSE